jgi:putative transposase
MTRCPRSPSQSWRTFLENHAGEFLAADFFTVPTVTFRVLFVFVILSHDRRRILHTNVTAVPSERWTAQQVLEAIGTEDSYRFLLRDRDVKYGEYFVSRVASAGLKHVVTAPGSPWQNAYAERVIGTIRRECTDHAIVLGEQHLRCLMRRYVAYYNGLRTHLALGKDAPDRRDIQPPDRGCVRSRPHCGGLHHEYFRKAA